MQDPLHELDAQYASLDEPTLLVLLAHAQRERDADALEPLIRQLVLRAVPVVERTVRELGRSRGFAASDLRLIEEEALTKLMLRLQRGSPVASMRVLAYETARACAQDPGRKPAPAPAGKLARVALRAVPSPRAWTGSNEFTANGRGHGHRDD